MNDLNLTKRARAKYFTLAFLYPLIDLGSVNNKKYWSAWHCSRILKLTHYENKTEVKGMYCKQRFCTVCNRIRTAHYIHAYNKIIDSFNKPYFLTLTTKNVLGKQLRPRIKQYGNFFRLLNKTCTRKFGGLKYLRKFNIEDTTYHPHYHIVCEDLDTVGIILGAWMNYFKYEVSINAQDVQECDTNAKIELFKYFTNVIKRKGTKYEFEPIAFDLIISALDRIRIFQPVGIKKFKESEQLELFSENIDDLLHETEFFYDDKLGNWIDFDHKTLLTSYKPSDKFIEMCKSIGKDDRDMSKLTKWHSPFHKIDKKELNLDAKQIEEQFKNLNNLYNGT
jgi:hypothetical protein